MTGSFRTEWRIVDATGNGEWTWDDYLLSDQPSQSECSALVDAVNSGQEPVDDDVPLPLSVEWRSVTITAWKPA